MRVTWVEINNILEFLLKPVNNKIKSAHEGIVLEFKKKILINKYKVDK